MKKAADFLVEIGTEELPPKALNGLMEAFAAGIRSGLEEQRLGFDGLDAYASPRRLAVVVRDLSHAQEDREVEHKGPPIRIAFDDNGEATAAANAFAKKCGVPVDALGRSQTGKGEWLTHKAVEHGRTAAELLPEISASALGSLPIPKPMRWGDSDTEFVRPVHWVVMLHGSDVIEGRLLGVATGNQTRGHRFHAPQPLTITRASDYPEILEDNAFVVADVAERKRRIAKAVAEAAEECGGVAVGSDALFDEVTALVEWPVALTGSFDEAFLELPREVIVATLTSHQRYFPIADDSGSLLPSFITIANLASLDPGQVRQGNERVIRPRLADAAFFWDADRRIPLADRQAALAGIVYQKGLGTIGDKSARVAALAGRIAAALGADVVPVERAAELAKCDLVTGMVGEFPELQGTMGRYYASEDNEAPEVAAAIGEQYMPRFAGDAIPAGLTGQCVAIADKLDSIAGIFALGKKPSGNRDPFGLRRSALGIVRIVVEAGHDLELPALINAAVGAQPIDATGAVADDIYDYIVERMRAYCLDRDATSAGAITAEMFEAVRARRPASLYDIELRLCAVAAFVALEAAASLAAANKRIGNILRQADYSSADELDASLLSEPAEIGLYEALGAAREAVAPLLAKRDYTETLNRLAALREPVDAFFDDVMVMVDDERVKLNRLALLADVRQQFLDVADISRLSIKST